MGAIAAGGKNLELKQNSDFMQIQFPNNELFTDHTSPTNQAVQKNSSISTTAIVG